MGAYDIIIIFMISYFTKLYEILYIYYIIYTSLLLFYILYTHMNARDHQEKTSDYILMRGNTIIIREKQV